MEHKTCFCRLPSCSRYARQPNPYEIAAAAAAAVAVPAALFLVVLDPPSVSDRHDGPEPLVFVVSFSTPANDRRLYRDTCLQTCPRPRSRAPKSQKRVSELNLSHVCIRVYARCVRTTISSFTAITGLERTSLFRVIRSLRVFRGLWFGTNGF
jgi:hypothetical protein